jgi:hypothetical protein
MVALLGYEETLHEESPGNLSSKIMAKRIALL